MSHLQNHRLVTPAPAEEGDGDASRSGPPLARGLKQRHLSMIALGGVIGAGLFVGSGAGIAAAGPSIVVACALSGVLVMLVMRMLGETSAADPASGSFSVHAERAIGPWAGFTAGWTLLCAGVGAEAIGAAGIMTGWFPGSVLVIVTLIPWSDPAVSAGGPYVAVLDHLGIPAAGQLMNVIVLIALLSAMNANVYGSSRMAYSLIARGHGPKALGKVSGGVPRRAVIASSAFGFLAVLLSCWWPQTVFTWLLDMVGAAVPVVWGFIAAAQLRMRRRLEREAPGKLVVKMWAFPVLTWTALAGVLAILALMALMALMARQDDTRVQLYFTGGLTLALSLVGCLRQKAQAART
ncbi:hypothetical protein [Streptomyces sp. NPDC002491]